MGALDRRGVLRGHGPSFRTSSAAALILLLLVLLGAPAAVYGGPDPLPTGEQERGHLLDGFAQLSGQGAHALLTIHPGIALGRVDEAQAAVLAGQLTDAVEGFTGTVCVRFAPQMNAPWVP